MTISLESCGPFHHWHWNIRHRCSGQSCLAKSGIMTFLHLPALRASFSLMNDENSFSSGKAMASTGQILAQARHSTTQLKGFFTHAFPAASSKSRTLLGQNSAQARQPMHFSTSMAGHQSISSLGMPRHSFMGTSSYGFFAAISLTASTASSVVLLRISSATCFSLSNPAASKASRNIFACILGSHPAT